jgi:hypothetical protein
MSLAACIIRLSGHDLMDFRNYSGVAPGGSDGCVNFNDPDNAGLAYCLNIKFIESISNLLSKCLCG